MILADGVDLIAVQFDPYRRRKIHGKNVDDTAPAAKVADGIDPVDPFIAKFHQTGQQRLPVQRLAQPETTAFLVEQPRQRHTKNSGLGSSQHHNRVALIQSGKRFRTLPRQFEAAGPSRDVRRITGRQFQNQPIRAQQRQIIRIGLERIPAGRNDQNRRSSGLGQGCRQYAPNGSGYAVNRNWGLIRPSQQGNDLPRIFRLFNAAQQCMHGFLSTPTRASAMPKPSAPVRFSSRVGWSGNYL